MAKSKIAGVTFVLTEDCQLRCRYCYLIGKNGINKNSFLQISKAIDVLLKDPELLSADKIIFSFIGGEPLLEIDLLIRSVEYLSDKIKSTVPKWRENYTVQITTNGILYNSKKVQQFIDRYHDNLSISISIDGTREKFNTSRMTSGFVNAYDIVLSNVYKWTKQFDYTTTRMVISHDDLRFVAKSALFLLEQGISYVDMNLVVEDTWTEGDDGILEEQLMLLADRLLEKNIDAGKRLSIFAENYGVGVDGSGQVRICGDYNIALGTDGYFYSCFRFMSFSLRNKKPYAIGNICSGIDHNRMRPLYSMDFQSVYSPKCLECPISRRCKWCAAENYDSSLSGTIFQRPEVVCKLHQACVRVNNYYHRRLSLKG